MAKTKWIRKEVAGIADLSDRRVLYYSEQAGLLPDLEPTVGSGIAREYSKKDVISLLLIKELADFGFALSKIKEIMFNFFQIQDKWWDAQKNEFKKGNSALTIYKAGKKGFTMGYKELGNNTECTLLLNRHPSAIVINVGLLVERSGL